MTVSMRVVADHTRAMTFLIGDGVLPSNEGRGYVLRRIMRRAARHGVLLGLKTPFLFQVSGAVVETMRETYPELAARATYIAKIIKNEEARFLRTLEKRAAFAANRIEKQSDKLTAKWRSNSMTPSASRCI
jgi:alanyl-tRNA synthetase